MLRIVIILCILLLALFFLFPEQMEQITEDGTEQISDVVEEVTDRVGDLGGESHVSIVPAGTTNLELSLIEAAERGAVGDVRDLLARGANVNGRRTDGASALVVAAEAGHLSVVTLLVGEGAQVDSRDSRGRSALMRATAQGRTGIVRELVRAGADPNLGSKSGNFPLLEAALFGDADVRARAENDWTALKAAEDRGHSDIAAMLRSAGGTL